MRRGGVLKDALSNIALQRSAIRGAHMTSLCRSRPLNAALGVLRESMKKSITILFFTVALTLGLCDPVKGQQACQYWASRVDPRVQSAMDDKINEQDPKLIIQGIGCLLKMEGNRKPARFSGATRLDTSQIFEPARVEVAALFYISYLYYQSRDSFAGGIALRGADGKISSRQTTRKAYGYYRRWFNEVKKIGIEKARELEMPPLKGKDVSWY